MVSSNTYLLKGGLIVNEGKVEQQDILIKQGRIEKIGTGLVCPGSATELNLDGLHVFPGVIDDQVHFREPGLTHKATVFTESRAAVAGGITSFMEMPNVIPQTLTQELLQAKYDLAGRDSVANYSFYMGASNDNLEEVLKTPSDTVCGVKIFMGSSTGNMLVDNQAILEGLFKNVPLLIATHCEDEETIRLNTEKAKEEFGEDIPFDLHPVIRSSEACYLSSSRAVALAKKHNTRLHILHISTAKETSLFDSGPVTDKQITSEACIHHLWFSDADYLEKGPYIKWNPAVKTAADREGIWKALLNNQIDVIATDHAPHTLQEKHNKYLSAPSGGPLVQHSLVAMLAMCEQRDLDLPWIAHKMSHAVADCFQISDRGYIREGYFADLAIVNLNDPWSVKRDNVLAKCGWSPFEGVSFNAKVVKTFVSGNLVYDQGQLIDSFAGQRLTFSR